MRLRRVQPWVALLSAGLGLVLWARLGLWMDPVEHSLLQLTRRDQPAAPAATGLQETYLVLALIEEPRAPLVTLRLGAGLEMAFEEGLINLPARPGQILTVDARDHPGEVVIRVVETRGLKSPREGTQWRLEGESLEVFIH